MAEAKSKAERIRGDSERELAAATQRRDSINAQLSNVRQMLTALGGVAAGNPVEPAAAAAGQPRLATAVAAPAEQHRAVSDVKGGKDVPATDRVETDKLRDDKAKGRQYERQEGRPEPGARRQGLSVRDADAAGRSMQDQPAALSLLPSLGRSVLVDQVSQGCRFGCQEL